MLDYVINRVHIDRIIYVITVALIKDSKPVSSLKDSKYSGSIKDNKTVSSSHDNNVQYYCNNENILDFVIIIVHVNRDIYVITAFKPD